jgi:peptidoglycan/xylan/chitin deacetylase (PgdA/CDA1 family)
MYHSVSDHGLGPLDVTVRPDRFDEQLRWLRARGLRGVDVSELLEAHARGADHGLVGLTFDDGYADFATDVVPALARHGFTATVYVLADRLGGYNEWDQPGPIKSLMTAGQIKQVAAAGMEVGSHGLRHVSLPEVTDAELVAETVRSREVLSALLGMDVTGFAYPYGRMGRREVEAARAAGYWHACAVEPSTEAGILALPRTFVGQCDGWLRLLAKQLRHTRRRYVLPASAAAQ